MNTIGFVRIDAYAIVHVRDETVALGSPASRRRCATVGLP